MPDSAGAEVVLFITEDAAVASEALARFGKGRHPARLNLGDCLAHAVAKRMRLPLIFIGEEFALNDVVVG
jgi:ribonuclease VapC